MRTDSNSSLLLLFLSEANEILTDMYKDSKKRIDKFEEAAPIKTIGKLCHCFGGESSWILVIWELIIDQLVKGTPPTSVNDNIKDFVRKLSPTTKIRELPSIWKIRQTRLFLLVIVQTLAAYSLSKAKKW